MLHELPVILDLILLVEGTNHAASCYTFCR